MSRFRWLAPSLIALAALPLSLSPATTPAAWAQDGSPDLPPDDKVALALDGHPAVTAAGARLEAARSQEQMLVKGPQEISVSGSYLRRTVDTEGGYNEFDVSVTRPVRLPGKATLDRKAGRFGVEVAQNRMEDMRHQTSLSLSTLWFDWLTAGALLANDRATVANLDRALQAVRRRVQLRDAAQIDIDQAASALALAQGQMADSRARLDEAKALLAANFPEIPLADEPPAFAVPRMPVERLETLRDHVVSRSHEIGAAESEAERMSTLARRAKADRVPDPSLGFRLFSERGGAEKGVGVLASVPLGGGYRKAAAGQAAAEAGSARLELASVRRSVEAMANADMSNAGTRYAVWQSMTTASDRARDAAERTRRGYLLGALDLSDLLYAERQANDARRAEIAARSEARRALMKLLIDSHTIWAPAE